MRSIRNVVLILFLLAACAPAAVTATLSAPSPLPSAIFSPLSTKQASDSSTQPWVDQAVADLAARLNVPASEIEVVSSEAVVWSDGSLGCPQPGVAYIQILIEGYRVQLKHAGRIYEYHGSDAHAPGLCENPQPPALVNPGN